MFLLETPLREVPLQLSLFEQHIMPNYHTHIMFQAISCERDIPSGGYSAGNIWQTSCPRESSTHARASRVCHGEALASVSYYTIAVWLRWMLRVEKGASTSTTTTTTTTATTTTTTTNIKLTTTTTTTTTTTYVTIIISIIMIMHVVIRFITITRFTQGFFPIGDELLVPAAAEPWLYRISYVIYRYIYIYICIIGLFV